MDVERIIREKRNRVGASETAAILGLSEWSTAREVYDRIVGDHVIPDNNLMEWGRRLESAILQKFRDNHPALTVLGSDDIATLHEGHVVCHLDAAIVRENGSMVPVEIKTQNAFMAAWENVPMQYRLQTEVQMHLAKSDHCYVALLAGGNEYSEFRVKANKELAGNVVDRMNQWFEDHVVARTPPPMTTPVDARRNHPAGELDLEIVATPEIEDAVMRLNEMKGEEKALSDEKSQLQAQVMEHMGEASILVTADGLKLVTWRKSKDSQRMDWKGVAEDLGEIYIQDHGKDFDLTEFARMQPGSRRFLLK